MTKIHLMYQLKRLIEKKMHNTKDVADMNYLMGYSDGKKWHLDVQLLSKLGDTCNCGTCTNIPF